MHNPILSIAATATVWSFGAVEYAKSAKARLADEEDGQTAAEYLGIIVLVATIFAAIFALKLHERIGTRIGNLVDSISGGSESVPAPAAPAAP